MIKALAIDDEIHCLKALGMLLEEHCPDIQLLETCASAKKGLEMIERLRPDLVFLDIEMPVLNGFELLEQLAEIPFAVIFTTSYDQYAIRAFRFNALDYLLKPIDPDELIGAVKKVKAQDHHPIAEQFHLFLKHIQGKTKGINKIAVPISDGFELIPIDDIIYFEASDNYTHVFRKNKSKVVARRTLKEIEEQLNDFSFMLRVHHSFVVNLNEVTKYVRGEGGYLVMTDGSIVNVSRSRKETLMKLF